MPLRAYMMAGSLEAQPSAGGVDMTNETLKILLVLLMFGGLEAAMRLQPAVLKRRSRRIRR